MGEKDVVSKNYLSNSDRFAQMYNNGVFHGQPLIQPEKLRDLTPEEMIVLEHRTSAFSLGNERKEGKKDRTVLHKYRDILKIYDDQAILAIYGIENQTEIHYAMPLRHMLYDALNYEKQRAVIEQRHRKKNDLSGAELLSGFSILDRLIPVMTLAVYWGTKPWDGPKELHEMLDIPPDLLHYKDKIGNYPMNLLEVRSIPNLEQYHGELKALLGFIKYQKNPALLKEFMAENKFLFQSMTMETVRAITVLGNAKQLETSVINRRHEGREMIDVCEALEVMIEEGRIEGQTEGGIRTLIEDNLEEGISEERILEKLQKRFRLSSEQALAELEKYR